MEACKVGGAREKAGTDRENALDECKYNYPLNSGIKLHLWQYLFSRQFVLDLHRAHSRLNPQPPPTQKIQVDIKNQL